MHDFHLRIRVNTSEGVAGVTDDVVSYIRERKIDEFGKYIRSSKRHDLFKQEGTRFYDKLDDLRKIRNRVHIQNKWNNEPKNEYDLFTDINKNFAEICLEVVVKTMHHRYRRPDDMNDFVGELKFPWEERLKTFTRT